MPLKINTVMMKIWGIYRGFNPHTNPLNKWVEPECENCQSTLTPWIDWKSVGCIGYCEECKTFHIVKSDWIPSPHAHIREEIEELVKHEVRILQIGQIPIKSEVLWAYHENIPLDESQAILLNELRKRVNRIDSEESRLIEHIIWSLIFNSNKFDKSLIREYIYFLFKRLQYLKPFANFIWVGDDYDIATNFENEFKLEMAQTIYEIWNLHKFDVSIGAFKTSIGLYVPSDRSVLERYGEEFVAFTRKIKARM